MQQAMIATLLAGLTAPAMACGAGQRAEAARRIVLAQAQTSTTDSPARPARGPQSQTSVSHGAPPAGTKHVTGSTAQSGTVKQMNEAEKDKVNTEGK